MSGDGGAQPDSKPRNKPPKRYWQASESFWDFKASHWVGVTLTLALIFVGISQLYIYYRQALILRGQLTEMEAQRLLTVAQLRANLRRDHPDIRPIGPDGQFADSGQQIAGWVVMPRWKNVGPTMAKDYIGWFKIFPFGGKPSHPLTAQDCPSLARPAEASNPSARTVIQPGQPLLQFGQRLSLRAGVRAHDGNGYILMVGHIQYRDIFPGTPPHYDDWCVVMIPNDINRNIWSLPILYERAG